MPRFSTSQAGRNNRWHSTRSANDPLPPIAGFPGRIDLPRPSSGVGSFRLIAYPTGRRALVLADGPGGLPVFWINAYLLERTLAGASVSTQRGLVRGILRGMRYCAANDIDIPERCRSDLLTDDELKGWAADARGPHGVPRSAARAEYSSFVAFLAWMSSQVRSGDRSAAADRRLFFKDADRWAPSGTGRPPAPPRDLTAAQRVELVRAIDPASPIPVFGAMAYRNKVLILTAYLLGLRTGELLGLKVGDLDFKGWTPTLTVARRPHDREDTRKTAARQKTLEPRTLPLSPQLADAFRELLKERRKLQVALGHAYVFVNVSGEPLGERGLRKVYQELRRACPILAGVSNHWLRHDWCNRWNMATDRGKWDNDLALRLQSDAMGWRPGSTMPLRYGRGSLQRLASEASLSLQAASLRAASLP